MPKNSEMKLPDLSHVGIVVRDIKQTVDHYTRAFGLGPCEIFTYNADQLLYKGKPASSRILAALVNTGPVELHIMQPLDEGPLTEFLEKNGDGVHHLCFLVDDVDPWIYHMKGLGKEPVIRIERQDSKLGRVRVAYLDSKSGPLFELLEYENMPQTKKRNQRREKR